MTANDRAAAVITRLLETNPHTAPAVLANEIIQALRGHGWRPTNATRPPAWHIPPESVSRTPPPEWTQARNALKDRQ